MSSNFREYQINQALHDGFIVTTLMERFVLIPSLLVIAFCGAFYIQRKVAKQKIQTGTQYILGIPFIFSIIFVSFYSFVSIRIEALEKERLSFELSRKNSEVENIGQ